jgi:hypothetical protein
VRVGLPQGAGGLAILFNCIPFYNTHQVLVGLQHTAALSQSLTLPRALSYTTKRTATHCCVHCQAHCRTLLRTQSALRVQYPAHCRTLPHTAAHCYTHCCTLPHCRTHYCMHCHTLPHCRTAAHCRTTALPYTTKRTTTYYQAHFHTLPCALPHTTVRTATHCCSHCHTPLLALPHTTALPHTVTHYCTLPHCQRVYVILIKFILVYFSLFNTCYFTTRNR